MIFLVDSGAERTVLRDGKGIPLSKDTIKVLSANGRVTKSPISKPLTFELCDQDDQNEPVELKVVLAPECPHNLLGRDLILSMGLSIGPGPNNKLIVAKHRFYDAQCLVMEGTGVPYYWWSLDLPVDDPGQIAKTLLTEIKTFTTGKPEFMDPSDLHVTLRFKCDPGPDPDYDKAIHKLGPQSVTLTYLYFDKKQSSFCDVTVPSAVRALMPLWYRRHVSLSKNPKHSWRSLGHERDTLSRVTDWEPTEDPRVQYSPTTKWYRKIINYRTTTTPASHLSDI